MSEAREQLEGLFVRLERRLTNVVYRWLWDREEVRDVVQDAFLRLWRARDRVDWTRAEPLVYRIALNLARNRRRRRKLWRWVGLDRTPDLSTAGGPQVSLEEAEEDLRVRRAIDALPEGQRQVLVLCTFAEMSYDQIGELLGISAGTVASRRNTAIAKVKQLVEMEKTR
jgi:RNA polymerase sigma-70 factor (ECF subfamily)